jgi:hypothetical protein
MGADKPMVGYGRHRKADVSGGWAKLRNELNLDLPRVFANRTLGEMIVSLKTMVERPIFRIGPLNVIKF